MVVGVANSSEISVRYTAPLLDGTIDGRSGEDPEVPVKMEILDPTTVESSKCTRQSIIASGGIGDL